MKKIGDRVRLTILRDAETFEQDLKIGAIDTSVTPAENLTDLLAGLRIENNPDGGGVLVVGLDPNSPAAYSGLRPGDVIVGANKRRVRDIEALRLALRISATSILLQVERNGGSLFIVIR